MNPDTLASNKEIIESSINWWQIVFQTFIFGIIVELSRRYFQRELEYLKKEFTIIQTTFSKNYSFVLKYYKDFYNHYRDCQNVVNSDRIDYSDNTSKFTDDIFLGNLDSYVNNVRKLEPTIRLIFPNKIIQNHADSITAFHDFGNLVKSYKATGEKPQEELLKIFRRIETIKNRFEKELKRYLRTEELYS